MSANARLWLGLVLLAVMVGIVQWSVGWPQLLAPWRSIAPSALALATLLASGSYMARALRLYDYFPPGARGGFVACLKLTLLHNLFNNLLPMRAGEASFPVLMNRYFKVPLSRSLTALLWFRLMDLHALAAVAILAVGRRWWDSGWIGLLAAVWLILPWWSFRLQSAPALVRLSERLSPRWRDRLARASEGLPQTPAAFWRAWFWTQLNWLVKLAVFAWILRLFAPMPGAAAVMGALGGDLTSVLPVHGIAGAGTYEAGVVAALIPFGIEAKVALAAAVNLHLFVLGLSAAGGALALLLRAGGPAAGWVREHG